MRRGGELYLNTPIGAIAKIEICNDHFSFYFFISFSYLLPFHYNPTIHNSTAVDILYNQHLRSFIHSQSPPFVIHVAFTGLFGLVRSRKQLFQVETEFLNGGAVYKINGGKTTAYTYEAFFASDGRSKKKHFEFEATKPKYKVSNNYIYLSVCLCILSLSLSLSLSFSLSLSQDMKIKHMRD